MQRPAETARYFRGVKSPSSGIAEGGKIDAEGVQNTDRQGCGDLFRQGVRFQSVGGQLWTNHFVYSSLHPKESWAVASRGRRETRDQIVEVSRVGQANGGDRLAIAPRPALEH